jgi:hypothetical protein
MLRALGEHYGAVYSEGTFDAYMLALRGFEPAEIDGDALLERLSDPDLDEELAPDNQIAFNAAAAYSLQALACEKAGDITRAWTFAFSAGQWEGYLSGKLNSLPAAEKETQALWRRLVKKHIIEIDGRHSKNRATAEEAMRWLAEKQPANIKCDAIARTLSWRRDGSGHWSQVEKKSVQTELSKARKGK